MSPLIYKNINPKWIHTESGFSLETDLGALTLDFLKDHLSYQRPLPRGKNELLAKAIGFGKGVLKVVDATTGLAQDALMLARLGGEQCQITGIERSDWIYPLLQQAHGRALREGLCSSSAWVHRLVFIKADACNYLQNLTPEHRPDAIYLDPMFPEKKKSALSRKEMEIFKALVGEDLDSVQLLKAALQVARFRVVVKRPLKAEPLGSEKVTHSFIGNSVRYDMYLCPEIQKTL